MPDHTPADKPVLPAPDGQIEIRIAGRPVDIDCFRPSTVVDYGRQIEAWARADERRKVLEEAARLGASMHPDCSPRQVANAIRAMIDRKEPTT